MAQPVPPEAPPGAAPEAPVAHQAAPDPRGLPRNYRDLLRDETNGPRRDRLASYLHGYRFEGGGLPAPTALREQTVVLSDRQPMTFLCLITGAHGAPEVSVLHRMMRYMDMPGEDESGYHDRYLGLLGDIMPHQYPTVTLYRFAVLCQTLFQGVAGPENPFVAAQWKLAEDMQNAAPFIANRYLQVYTPTLASVYFPGIVRAVQVGVHEYLHHVGTNAEAGHHTVELPDYRSLVWDLRRGTFQNSSNWLPIPEGYLTPRSTGVGGSRTQATASTVSTSGASVCTGISSITNDTPRTVVARIENPHPDPEFFSIVVRPGRFRPILQTCSPPTNDAGAEFCVAWWLRGACFPNCGKRAAHVPFASATERTRLLTFCREHLAAPATGGT